MKVGTIVINYDEKGDYMGELRRSSSEEFEEE